MNGNLPMNIQTVELEIPAFQERESVTLSFSNVKEGERRLVEARIVTPSTYSDLSYSFNEGYREARTNIRNIGYELVQMDKKYRQRKSELIMDEYPEYLKTSGMKDNATLRDAFLEKDKTLNDIEKHINFLKALNQLMEDKIKIFENVCKYMKVQMDLVKNGNFDSNKY